MATSTTSASNDLGLPPSAASLSILTDFPLPSTAVTLRPSSNFMPCFLKMRADVLRISSSMPGRICGRYSITVTSAPRRRQTEPSSNPITPPPMTTMRPGTDCRSSAPVEDTIFFSSISMKGSVATSEPVAMTMFLAV